MVPAVNEDLPWRVEHLPFDEIDVDQVRQDETLFYLLASASLVESGSDIYTRNLVDYYGEDPEVSGWLSQRWEQEELQHGRALRAYIEHVWPDFDWDKAFRQFFAEYSRACTTEAFEPTPALELAARCVVEMGTASLYRSLRDYATEPVLRSLLDNIRSDEVRHYKYFYRYFRAYNERAGHSRARIFVALVRRLMEMRNDDADVALRHVMAVREPSRGLDQAALRDMAVRTRELVRRNLAADMSVKMFLRPLDFPPRVQAGLGYPLTKMMQHVVLR